MSDPSLFTPPKTEDNPRAPATRKHPSKAQSYGNKSLEAPEQKSKRTLKAAAKNKCKPTQSSLSEEDDEESDELGAIELPKLSLPAFGVTTTLLVG